MNTISDGYIIRYIRTKNKIRKIITYGDNSIENRQYHEKVVAFLRKKTINSRFAKAYIRKSSIRSNAKTHLYNDVFIKMDIKDYFHNISHKKLAKCLYYEINKSTEISYRECCEIVRKCSIGDNGLPLGLVASPDLANLYLKEFDGIFYGYIKKTGLENPIYTRYADDIVVSYKAKERNFEHETAIINMARKLLNRYGLKLNNRKTKITDLNKSNHVRITGISITKDENNFRHLSVGNKLKNRLYWEILSAYDEPAKYTRQDILRIKGMLSFVLSIEKKDFDRLYSEKMKQLIKDRGFSSLIDMADTLVGE